MPVKYIKKYKESTGTEEGGGLKDTRDPEFSSTTIPYHVYKFPVT